MLAFESRPGDWLYVNAKLILNSKPRSLTYSTVETRGERREGGKPGGPEGGPGFDYVSRVFVLMAASLSVD